MVLPPSRPAGSRRTVHTRTNRSAGLPRPQPEHHDQRLTLRIRRVPGTPSIASTKDACKRGRRQLHLHSMQATRANAHAGRRTRSLLQQPAVCPPRPRRCTTQEQSAAPATRRIQQQDKQPPAPRTIRSIQAPREDRARSSHTTITFTLPAAALTALDACREATGRLSNKFTDGYKGAAQLRRARTWR